MAAMSVSWRHDDINDDEQEFVFIVVGSSWRSFSIVAVFVLSVCMAALSVSWQQ